MFLSASDGRKSAVLSCTYDLDACYPLPYPCPNPTRQQTVLMCKCLVFQFLSFKLNYKMIKCQGVTSPHLQLEFHFYSVHNHVYSFRNILHLSDWLYLVSNHVYSSRNVLHLPDCLYLVPNHVYSFRNILHLPDCLYLVANHVYSFRIVLHLPDCLYLVPNHVYSLRNVLHLHLLNIHQIDRWILISTEFIWFPITWHISGAMFWPGTTWPLQMGYFNPKFCSR